MSRTFSWTLQKEEGQVHLLHLAQEPEIYDLPVLELHINRVHLCALLSLASLAHHDVLRCFPCTCV